jgi:hypothetical protein
MNKRTRTKVGEMTMRATIIHPNKAMPEIIIRRDHGRKDIRTKMRMAIKYQKSLRFMW